MAFGRKLRCSFCNKDEDHVQKLVAGPRVYICDECVTIVKRIMDSSDAPQPRPRNIPWLSRLLRLELKSQ
jgi:ATP-dependent Clp protease ATP-binding subunit ClpX